MATNVRLTKVQTVTTFAMRVDKEEYVIKVVESKRHPGLKGGRSVRVYGGVLEANTEYLPGTGAYDETLKIFKQLSGV